MRRIDNGSTGTWQELFHTGNKPNIPALANVLSSNNGRVYLPFDDDTELLLQWDDGPAVTALGATTYRGTVTFPVGFSACYGVMPFLQNADGALDYYATVSLEGAPSATNFKWKLRKITSTGAWQIRWLAWGKAV